MKLYFYKKDKKRHTRADTDAMILASVDAFCAENKIEPYTGSVLRTENGKPYLEKNFRHIGVTHTEDVVIVSVSEKKHGIDCERSDRAIKNPRLISERFFTENEQKHIMSMPDIRAAFIDVWVKKEAYVKYTGEGLSGMRGFDALKTVGFTSIENDMGLTIYIYEYKENTK